jgi:hypothetical protein
LPGSAISVAADGAGAAPPDAAANQGGIAMSSALGTIATFVFTFGVFAVLGFALYHLYTSARDNSPRLPH